MIEVWVLPIVALHAERTPGWSWPSLTFLSFSNPGENPTNVLAVLRTVLGMLARVPLCLFVFYDEML